MIPMPTDGTISIVARSPGLDTGAVEVVVTVPTFRRPDQVLTTLASIRSQQTARRFAIVLIENDAEGLAGVRAAAPLFESGELPGLLIIAHDRGNCSAYNAGWRTALAEFPNFRFIAVIDDDEIADPDWLEQFCRAAEHFDASIVGGPQVPVFPDAASEKWATHPVFAPPYRESGPVAALYSSGNLFVSHDVLARMEQPFLDLHFNFMGGGDSDFLSRAAQKGFRLAWCAEAKLRETIPARRLQADWVQARGLRNGVISTLVEKKKRAGSPFGAARVVAKSLLLLAASPVRGLVRLLKTGSPAIALYPIHVALGRILAEFGYANEQYRQPEKN